MPCTCLAVLADTDAAEHPVGDDRAGDAREPPFDEDRVPVSRVRISGIPAEGTPFQLKGGGRVPPPRQGGLYLGTADEKNPPTTEELNRAHSDVEAKLATCKAYFTDGTGPGSPAVYQTVIDVVESLKKSQDAREHSKWLVILTDTADIHRCDQNGNPADDLGQLKQNARAARQKIDELRAAAKCDDGEQFKVRAPIRAPCTLPNLTLT